ncbi:ATP-grasp domain-containing protein [Pseudodesulfovibrio tunisiensis]|uniref:ATP-grasp domain-containing protein n=1 Tax=Pseudodesulfovibrio tunisiensis TaxID=463192 RepID=UPI001FB5242F|nr:ATP-grasp domain-containing protein [Pseudodesulfovibrio tunisiensis]
MLKIIVLSCGTNANYHLCRIFKKNFPNNFYLIGADTNSPENVPNISLLDEFYQIPSVADSAYYSAVVSICKKERPDFILPTFDKEQLLFHPQNPDLNSLSIKSLSTPYESLVHYNNKKNMSFFLKANGFDVPKIHDKVTLNENQDYFVKPIDGVGSVGARLMRGSVIKELDDPSLLVQEVCRPPEITMEVFRYGTQISTVTRERIQTKAGVCTKAKLSSNKNLEDVAKRLIRCIQTPHFFNLQFMKNSQNNFVITDVNFRLAGGMSISYAGGWDEASALAHCLLQYSEKKIFAPLQLRHKEQWVSRVYTEVVTQFKD